jgi:hypothetical protein
MLKIVDSVRGGLEAYVPAQIAEQFFSCQATEFCPNSVSRIDLNHAVNHLEKERFIK